MTRFGFMGNRKGDKPPHYYRTGLVRKDFERAMIGCGQMTLMQVAAALNDRVSPESKRRYFELSNEGVNGASIPLDQVLWSGMRRIVQLRMRDLINDGKVRKHGTGKDAKYEWIADQDSQSGSDSPGRGHAKPKGTRPGRN